MTTAAYDTDVTEAAPEPPLSRREEARRDKLARAEQARLDRAAQAEQDRLDRLAQMEEDRLRDEREEARREREAQRRQDKKDERRRAREDAIADAGEWLTTHRDDVMLAPIIAVPAILSWSAQSDFGIALYAGTGRILPVLSEVGMWYFAFRIEDARRHGEKLFPLYVGMVFCVLVCAGLSFAHGLLGPIPGSIGTGVLTGLAYALVAISGIIIHQLGTIARRKRQARKTPKRTAPRTAPRTAQRATAGAMTVTVMGATERATEGATRGATEGATRQPVAPSQAPALPAAGGHGSGATEPETPARKLSRDDPANCGFDFGFAPEELSTPGGTKEVMRRYWNWQVEIGNIPSGGDLNRAVGKDSKYSLGKRYAREWRQEIGGTVPAISDGDASPAGSAQDSALREQDAGSEPHAQMARTRTEGAPSGALAAGEGQ